MALDFITQKRLQLFSVGFAAGAAYFLHDGTRIGVWVALAVYLLAYFLPGLFHFLGSFADVPSWPQLVSCGVGILFAAYHGHGVGAVVCGALVAAIDGAFWPY